MDYKIIVPPTADGAQQVTIRRWLVEVGQPVKKGKDLVEATTEKIALYVSSPGDGILSEIIVAAGGAARIGDVLGTVRAE
jgi:pyruvate/2-oxoglutarate dehydrogenase complex dihydrolipoamide acyltransferase (E2) component